MIECGPTVTGACTGHYVTRDLWGQWPPETVWFVVGVAVGGHFLGRWLGLRGWRDWLMVWLAVAGIGFVGIGRLVVGSSWLVVVGGVGAYVCGWRIMRQWFPV